MENAVLACNQEQATRLTRGSAAIIDQAITGRMDVNSDDARSCINIQSMHAIASNLTDSTPLSPAASSIQMQASSSRARIYRTSGDGTTTKWVTRGFAALEFLVGIPLANQQDIIQTGYLQQQEGLQGGVKSGDEDSEGHKSEEEGEEGKRELELPTNSSRWWDKLHVTNKGDMNAHSVKNADLEQPNNEDRSSEALNSISTNVKKIQLQSQHLGVNVIAPGRRLDGREAERIQIPLSGVLENRTRQRDIARQAAIREWELQVAHALNPVQKKPLLDGRVFFSAKGSYPVGVYSVLRYEPKKEEAARRRRKLEERGGGGYQFVMPERDWRGTTYRALLPRVEKKNKEFFLSLKRHRNRNNKTVENESDDNGDGDGDDDLSVSSEESDGYVPGFLDDPEMVQGRHRHVMVGDRVTGCTVSSTIQFVKPVDLKEDLNKQFRDRFDGWEPHKRQHKFIGAKVIDGVYTVTDPTEATEPEETIQKHEKTRKPHSPSISNEGKETIRMPPSLTLSKIRKAKKQVLDAAVKAKLEVSTVALACVYFERLCLDCRVDKSNRRLSFAACLLLASKINEANVALVMQQRGGQELPDKKGMLLSKHRPSKKSNTMFASLLEFFTREWLLSLKNVFAAEWGVFAALGFSLHATPSQVAFHFKRLMKTLEWGQLAYLGSEMYNQWQDCLEEEALRREEREKRQEMRRDRQEGKLLKLERMSNRRMDATESQVDKSNEMSFHALLDPLASPRKGSRVSRTKSKEKKRSIFKKARFGFPRSKSTDTLDELTYSTDPKEVSNRVSGMTKSPSMPEFVHKLNESQHIALDIDDDVVQTGDIISKKRTFSV